MELSLNAENLIVVVIAVVIGALLIKTLTKLVFRVAGLAIIAVIGLGYLYFYTNYFENHQDNKMVKAVEKQIEKHIQLASLINFEKNHCKGKEKTRADSIKCECIVQPLLDDLNSRYTDEELINLMNDKDRYLKELLAALKRNQDFILRKLKQRQATQFWNEMVQDLKKGKFLTE